MAKGMHGNIKDMRGQTFGRLAVIERAEKRPGSYIARWLCRCDCGNKVVVGGHALRAGNRTHCGCDTKGSLRSLANLKLRWVKPDDSVIGQILREEDRRTVAELKSYSTGDNVND